jgi:hypothetical protein
LWRNPFRKKKRQKKSIFIYGTTLKKNESGRDFQQGQIWNDRSQKQKKNYGSHPLTSSMRQALFKCEAPRLKLKSLQTFLAIKRCEKLLSIYEALN